MGGGERKVTTALPPKLHPPMQTPSYVLDTSFIIRLLTQSPLPLFKVAADFLDQWTQGQPALHIPDLVLAEAYFALQHHYQYPKADALAALHALSDHSAIAVSSVAATVLSLPNLASARPGFIDRLIHARAVADGATLVTFEKSARKLAKVLVIET